MGDKKSYTSSFARIYDDIMSSVPYDLWYKYLQELLNSYDKDPDKIMDMACGTGNMSLRFAQDHKDIVGIDKSSSMLEIARQKIQKNECDITFFQKDVRNFNFPRQFDFVFCIFDSLNYILNIKDLEKVFSNVYKSLKKNGIFIFDLNTVSRLMSIEPGTTVFSGKNYTCFWEDIIDLKQTTWKVQLKIYFNDDQSQYFEEIHKETGYKKEDIISLLTSVGFSKVKVYKAFTFDEGKDSDNRLYYVVCKNNLQEKKLSLLNRFKKKVKWKFLSSCD